jgi:hypothetical protein
MIGSNHNRSNGHREETQTKTRNRHKRLFTLNEAGTYIGLSHWRVRSLIYSGQLAYDLHEQLTSALPSEIDRLCEAPVEPKVLQVALDRLFETLGQACELYEERMAIQGEASDSTSRYEAGPR